MGDDDDLPPWMREPDHSDQFRPVWEDNAPEDDLAGLGFAMLDLPPPKQAAVADVLLAFGDAEHWLTRLDARIAMSDPAIREGVRARLAYAEASGWLLHLGQWVHPHDLALRSHGLLGSVLPASYGQMARALPNTVQAQYGAVAEDEDMDDRVIARGVRFAGLLMRLGSRVSVHPVGSADDLMRDFGGLDDAPFEAGFLGEIDAWLAARRRSMLDEPVLLAALRAAQDWRLWDASDDHDGQDRGGGDLRATYVAAALARSSRRWEAIVVPFWAGRAAVRQQRALARRDPEIAMLDTVAEGARAGLRELDRMLAARHRAQPLLQGRTDRSRLGDVLDQALRHPVLAGNKLADRLGLSLKGGLRLLDTLVEAGVLREVTRRRLYRAFAI